MKSAGISRILLGKGRHQNDSHGDVQKRKGCHPDNQSSLLTLNLNTMKNTMQIYGFYVLRHGFLVYNNPYLMIFNYLFTKMPALKAFFCLNTWQGNSL
jgi:hypothetical protein